MLIRELAAAIHQNFGQGKVASGRPQVAGFARLRDHHARMAGPAQMGLIWAARKPRAQFAGIRDGKADAREIG
jgi:hypothetical protein